VEVSTADRLRFWRLKPQHCWSSERLQFQLKLQCWGNCPSTAPVLELRKPQHCPSTAPFSATLLGLQFPKPQPICTLLFPFLRTRRKLQCSLSYLQRHVSILQTQTTSTGTQDFNFQEFQFQFCATGIPETHPQSLEAQITAQVCKTIFEFAQGALVQAARKSFCPCPGAREERPRRSRDRGREWGKEKKGPGAQRDNSCNSRRGRGDFAGRWKSSGQNLRG